MSAHLYKIFNQSELSDLQDKLQKSIQECIIDWTGYVVEGVTLRNASSIGKELPVEKIVKQLSDADRLVKNYYHTYCLLLNRSALSSILDRIEDLSKETERCEFTQKLLDKFERRLTECFDLVGLEGDRKGQRVTLASDGRYFSDLGSGWLYMEINVNGKLLKWILSGEMVQAHQARVTRIYQGKIRDHIKENSIALTAQFGHVDLSIGEFRSLKKGDVLILDNQLSEQVQILSADDEVVCHAKLGSKHGSKVVQVTKLEGV